MHERVDGEPHDSPVRRLEKGRVRADRLLKYGPERFRGGNLFGELRRGFIQGELFRTPQRLPVFPRPFAPRNGPPALPRAVGLRLLNLYRGKPHPGRRLAGVISKGRIDAVHGFDLDDAVRRLHRNHLRRIRRRVPDLPAFALQLPLRDGFHAAFASPAVRRPAVRPPRIVERHYFVVP